MAIITSGEHNIIISVVVENKPAMLMYFCSLSLSITHPQSVLAVKCPQEIAAVNSEQISDAAHQICHLRWRASEGTVLENFRPRWSEGSPSPSSASVDPWSCFDQTPRTRWQEVLRAMTPSCPFSQRLPLWPWRQHIALLRMLNIIWRPGATSVILLQRELHLFWLTCSDPPSLILD